MMKSACAALALAILPASRLAALQCPDGAPPPCRTAEARPRVAAASPSSVAVLDPVAPAGDTAASELADGLAEDLAVRLGEVSRLTVRSRATVRRLRDASGMSMEQLGRALSASYLVSLSVRRSGGTLRFSAELTRAANGAQVWAAQYDRADQNLLAMQSEIARAVASGVAGRLLPAEQATLTARPTASGEAYGAYLRGLALRKAAGDDPRGLTQQLRAVALDSGFAAAWSELAIAQASMYWFYYDRSDERLALARAAAERGLRLAPNAAASHVAMAYVHYWGARDYDAALAELRVALDVNPNASDVYDAMANVQRRQGRWEASMASRRRAIELSPGDAVPISELGLTLLVQRRFAEADSAYERSAALGLESVNSQMIRVMSPLEQGKPLEGVRAGIALLASQIDYVIVQAFKDQQIALTLVRLVPTVQDAVLRSVTSAQPELRAGQALLSGQVLEVRGQSAAATAAYDSARVLLGELVRQRPDDAGLRGGLAIALAGSGHAAEAVREGEAATRLMPSSRDALAGPQLEATLAQVLIRTGETDRAMTILADLLNRPAFVTRTLLRTDPVYAVLRGNPRFQRLVEGN